MTDWHLILTLWPLPWSWSVGYWRHGGEVNVRFGPIQLETIHD